MESRQLVKYIRKACDEQAISLSVLSDGWILELEKDNRLHRIVGSHFGFNNQASAALAKDKVAAHAVLAEHNIPHVEHVLVKSHADTVVDTEVLTSLLERHGDLVLKPLDGSGGNFISRITNSIAAESFITESAPTAWAVCPYIDAEYETRLVVLNGKVELAYKKVQPATIRGVKLFNLSKGAVAVPFELVDDALQNIGLRAMSVLNLQFGAVDILTSTKGVHAVLEVNASFSLARYSQLNTATDEAVAAFYRTAVSQLFR